MDAIRETLVEVAVFARRLADIDERVGSDARVASMVAQVLPVSIAQSDAKTLQKVMAPLIVETVRKEIANSKDGIVQELYPIAGELVAAYIQDQFRRLLTGSDVKLRRVLSLRRAGLRVRSILTGVPYRKLKLLYHARVCVEQVLLIERGSGLMLDAWTVPEGPTKREQKANPSLIAGLLAAINEFSREALKGDASGLRTLDIGRAHIYLRATPKYIMAVKASGAGAPRLAPHVDAVLRHTLADLGEDGGGQQGSAQKAGAALEERVLSDASLLEGDTKRSPSFLYAVLGLAFGGLIAVPGSGMVDRARNRMIQDRAEQIVQAQPSIFASQVRVEAQGDGPPVVHVRGVLPSPAAAKTLRDTLQSALGGDVAIVEQFVFAVPENLLSQVSAPVQAVGTLASTVVRDVAAVPKFVVVDTLAPTVNGLTQSLLPQATDLTGKLLGDRVAGELSRFAKSPLDGVAGVTQSFVPKAADFTEKFINETVSAEVSRLANTRLDKVGDFTQSLLPKASDISGKLVGETVSAEWSRLSNPRFGGSDYQLFKSAPPGQAGVIGGVTSNLGTALTEPVSRGLDTVQATTGAVLGANSGVSSVVSGAASDVSRGLGPVTNSGIGGAVIGQTAPLLKAGGVSSVLGRR
jgi:hypothetical protein